VFLAKGSQFTKWLAGSTSDAKNMRIVLMTIAGAIVAITAGLTGLLGIIGAVGTAMALWAVVTSPITLTIAAVTAAVVLLVLMIEDFYTYLQGGDSIIGDFVDSMNPLKKTIEQISKLFSGLSKWKLGKEISMMEDDEKAGNLSESQKGMLAKMKKEHEQWDWSKKGLPSMAGAISNPSDRFSGFALPDMKEFAGLGTKTNIGTVNIDVKSPVDDPYKLGKAISDQLTDLENAARQQARPLTR
jgi:hypothetical protein